MALRRRSTCVWSSGSTRIGSLSLPSRAARLHQFLHELIAEYPEAVRPSSQVNPLGSGGGNSGSQLFRWSSLNGEILLRGWPVGVGPDRVQTIHAWIAAANSLSFVPQPIRTRRSITRITRGGRVWQLEPLLPGESIPTSDWDESLVRCALGALARLHACLAVFRTQTAPSPAVSARLAEIHWLMSGGFSTLQDAVTGASDPNSVAALRWIAWARRLIGKIDADLRKVATESVSIQPVLRDARPEHFLFTSGRLTGLVDYGAMDLDTPWVDLARLFLEIPDGPRRRMALDAYEQQWNSAMDGQRLLLPLTTAADLLVGAHWIRWHFVERRHFEDEHTIVNGIRFGLDCLATISGQRDRPRD